MHGTPNVGTRLIGSCDIKSVSPPAASSPSGLFEWSTPNDTAATRSSTPNAVQPRCPSLAGPPRPTR
ncbi:MAG: hypothetical protein GEV07_15930 [Streptosporangiales bacterium]|nr:hypothetical protein [Streptosporangiales bacterium]